MFRAFYWIGYGFVFVSLCSLACSHTVGTSKMIYSSTEGRPRWIRVIPHSRCFQYFVGISDNSDNLDVARNAALADALKDAVYAEGVEVSEYFWKLQELERKQLMDKVTIEGIAQIKLEQRALYYEEWKYYYRGGVSTKYRAFVLTRSKKLQPDGILKTAFTTFGVRFGAAWHSMLFPGWGQCTYDKRGKGYFFAYSGLLALGGVGYLHYRYEAAKDDLEDIQWRYDNAGNPSLEIEKELFDKKNEIDDMKRYRKNALYFGAAIYFASIADALLFGPQSPEQYARIGLSERLYLATKINHGVPSFMLCLNM